MHAVSSSAATATTPCTLAHLLHTAIGMHLFPQLRRILHQWVKTSEPQLPSKMEKMQQFLLINLESERSLVNNNVTCTMLWCGLM